MAQQNDWWKHVFDERYTRTYADIVTPDRTAQEVRFLLKYIIQRPRQEILDIACGDGRHLLALAKKGHRLTGVDYSSYKLNRLKKEATLLSLRPSILRQDIRKLHLKKKVDVALNMFTSFGYFQEESDHQRAAEKIAHAVRTGGLLFLDLPHFIQMIRKPFKDAITKRDGTLAVKGQVHLLPDGIAVKTSHVVDLYSLRWVMTRTWKDHKRKQSYTTSVRLFTLPEICALFMPYGFRLEKVWGDFKGGRFTADSPRMLVLLKKKG